MYRYGGTRLEPSEIMRHEDCFLYRYEGEDTPDILFLQGSPYHRGYAHGVLLADRIALSCAHILTILYGMAGGYTGGEGTPPAPGQIAQGKARMLATVEENLLPAIRQELPEFFDELRGLTEGVQTRYPDLPWEDMLILNTVPESVESPHGCSNVIAFGDATADGGLIHGINMDYNSLGVFHRGVSLCFVKSDRGNAYLCTSFNGSMAPMSFLNDKGISYGEMTSNTTERHWPQLPHWLQAKLYAGCAKTLDDALAIGRRTGGTTGFVNFLCQGQQGISIETAGELMSVRHPGEDRLKLPGLMFTTNFFGVFTPADAPGSLIRGQIEAMDRGHPALMGRRAELLTVRSLSQWIDLVDCPRYHAFESRLPMLYGKLDAQSMMALMSGFPISRGGENLPPLHIFCEDAPLPYGLPPERLSSRELASVYCLVTEPEKGVVHIAAGLEPAQAGRFLAVSIEEGLSILTDG